MKKLKTSILEFSCNFNLLKRTEDLFWENMDHYKNEDPEEFSQVFFKYDKKKVCLYLFKYSFQLMKNDDKFIESLIVSYIFEYNSNRVGIFKVVFDLDGNIVDDVFWED